MIYMNEWTARGYAGAHKALGFPEILGMRHVSATLARWVLDNGDGRYRSGYAVRAAQG